MQLRAEMAHLKKTLGSLPPELYILLLHYLNQRHSASYKVVARSNKKKKEEEDKSIQESTGVLRRK